MSLSIKNMYKHIPLKNLNDHKVWSWTPFHFDWIQDPNIFLNYNPKFEVYQGSSRQFTLIITRYTVTTGAILKELKKQKKSYIYINWDEFIFKGKIEFSIHKKIIKYGKNTFNLKNIKTIYWDYSEASEALFFARSKLKLEEEVFLARWQFAFSALEALDCNWIPGKFSEFNFESQNKFKDLCVANQMGLKIPKTFFTNEISIEIKKQLPNKNWILKTPGLDIIRGKQKTLNFMNQDLKTLSKFKTSSPLLLQEKINKSFDVRAVVVHGKVFAVKINSQNHIQTHFDWRGKENLVSFESFNLPIKISKQILKLAQKLETHLACVDIVMDENQNLYFLEMNKPGQWFYLEVLSGVPIIKNLVYKF